MFGARRWRQSSQATISHSSAPQLSSAAVRRASSRSSSVGTTSPPIHRGGACLPRSASPPASAAPSPLSLSRPRKKKTNRVKLRTCIRLVRPLVSPQPLLPIKPASGRGDSSNAIFVTPSWESLSPLLPPSSPPMNGGAAWPGRGQTSQCRVGIRWVTPQGAFWKLRFIRPQRRLLFTGIV